MHLQPMMAADGLHLFAHVRCTPLRCALKTLCAAEFPLPNFIEFDCLMAALESSENVSLPLQNVNIRYRSCKICAKILETKGFAVVESNLGELADSVEKGCAGCSLLLGGIIICQPPGSDLSLVKRSSFIEFRRDFYDGVLSVSADVGSSKLFGDAEDWSGIYIEYYTSAGERVSLFPVRDAPCIWPGIDPARHLPREALSVARWEMARLWINECLSQHPRCQGLESPQLPTRILDVSKTNLDDNFPAPFIFVPGIPTYGRYLSLSYRWGQAIPLQSTTSNIQSFEVGIPWSSIPKTLQDAIIVTRSLGIQYLWIDALCILQNDRLDWEKESSKMSTIYGNSYVTIAATAARDSTEGLRLSERDQGKRLELSTPLSRDKIYVRRARHPFGSPHMRDEERHPDDERAEEDFDTRDISLLQRGWTFQEHILSPRVLQFGPRELIFECNTAQKCECRLNHLPRSNHQKYMFYSVLSEASTDLETLTEVWHKILEEYTRRDLSRIGDALPAISGVAHLIHRLTGSRYYAGIWQHSIIEDLQWVTNTKSPQLRPTTYQAPTWSWAAAYNFVLYYDFRRQTPLSDLDARVLDIGCTSSGSDPMGMVTGGFLSIQAMRFEAELQYEVPVSFGTSVITGGCYIVHPYLQEENMRPDVPYSDPATRPLAGTPISCVVLSMEQSGYPFLLVVVQSPSNASAYERIGATVHPGVSEDFIRRYAKRETLTII